ncbi:hypothetical protein EJB05_56051, partial [Eragrostis curvula]
MADRRPPPPAALLPGAALRSRLLLGTDEEHDNSIPGAPHDVGWLERRNGNLMSGPCLLHRCDEQVLKKSSSSRDVAE